MRAVEREPLQAPARLAEGGDPVAEGLREMARRTQPTVSEEVAGWRWIAARTPHGVSRVWLWAGALGAAAIVTMMVARHDELAPAPIAVRTAPTTKHTTATTPPETFPTTARTVPAPERALPTTPTRRLALSARPRLLPAGHAALADEAIVDVTDETSARVSADAAWVRVVLERGQVALHVEKRVAGGPGFEVAAGPYRFRVLGTRFRVARALPGAAPIELWVDEGRVAVTRGGRTLSVVEAGGHWGDQAAREVVTAPASRAHNAAPPPVSPRARCSELAERASTAPQAVTCYLAQSREDGVAAETALYEAGRLRRDALGDSAGALEVFQQYRTRFPRGMLRPEVDLSIVELLPKVNRHREALDEIGRLLAEGRGEERAAELHVLRGNIYREVLEDFARAEQDYAAAETSRAPSVGDATFFRGVCLQAQGRADEARATFERYLAAHAARFAEEAQRRLLRLDR
jgi:tetratricopeptide (TPR) repeat protein